jgi:phosphoribosyl 1,2-cyclic phosphate phosphodiesterase
MRQKFDYVERSSYGFESVPRVRFNEQTAPAACGAAAVTPLPVYHGREMIYGFRIDGDGRRMAYIPDCNGIPKETLDALDGLDVMILDGLRPEEHPTHFSIGQAVEMLGRIQARQSFITHLTHSSEHTALQDRLGEAVTVPWDGLTVDLES